MLNQKMIDALNEQAAKEAFASQYYLAMGTWCEQQGLAGSAKFYYAQSDEERGHMRKFIGYVNDMDGQGLAPAVKAPPKTFKSLSHTLQLSLAHERGVTKAIHGLVELAQRLKDHVTFEFLQWFVAEQREEEIQFLSILDVEKILGASKEALYYLDKELGSRAGS